ncbi:hypothetical protein [Paraburkholderia tropica]|uniref:hypothetical protein n=1 Tax=Paraburkholderia tropica TaxID=92647 RepID=UPI002AB04D98|nr:hypothetical protein [Paraburkholderia tropica]
MSMTIRRPFVTSLDNGQRNAASTAVKQSAQEWPCTVTKVEGSIVTVSFQVQTPFTLQTMRIPMFGPEWVRYPIQEGTKGYAMAADTTLGHMSGLGSSTVPNTDQKPNLSSLVFMPIANVGWSATIDPNKLELYGPDGVVLHPTGNGSNVTLDTSTISAAANETITLTVGSSSLVMKDGRIDITGAAIYLNGALAQTAGPNGGTPTAVLGGTLEVQESIKAASIVSGDGVHLESHTHPVPDGTSSAPNPNT